MKKTSILAVLAAACTIASATTTTVPVPTSLTGANALAGEDAYSWGISLAPGQTITSASLVFNSITLTVANSSGKGVLYSDLLNLSSTLPGAHTYTDHDAAGDYFLGHYSAGNIASLGTQLFASINTTENWTITFSADELAALNLFAADGFFGIGLDPDCHYTVGSICLNYTTNVPDASMTAYLLGLALLGMEVTRRKLALAKK